MNGLVTLRTSRASSVPDRANETRKLEGRATGYVPTKTRFLTSMTTGIATRRTASIVIPEGNSGTEYEPVVVDADT